MALLLPQATDLLNSPDHSFLHRVVAVDSGANEQLLQLYSNALILSGSLTVKYDGGGSGAKVIAWDTNTGAGSTPEFQLWINASNYGNLGHTISEMYLFEVSYGRIWQFNRNQGNMGFGVEADYSTIFLPTAFTFAPAVQDRELSDSYLGGPTGTQPLAIRGLADFWASSWDSNSATDDRVRIGIGNINPTINGSRSCALHFWSYDNDPIYGGTTPVSKWELGTDYAMNCGNTFYLWNSLTGQRSMYIGVNSGGTQSALYWGLQAGNEQGDGTYGPSICIGDQAGYNKNTSGNNLLIGYLAGGSQTNGSNIVALGSGAAGGIDGDYNTCIGHYVASAGGAYNYSTQSFYAGNYINAGFGSYRIIIDTSGGTHNTYLKSSRHSLIFGTCSPSTPYNNSLYLNANVSVQGLNAICDDDSGEPIFDDNTGEMVFAEAA